MLLALAFSDIIRFYMHSLLSFLLIHLDLEFCESLLHMQICVTAPQSEQKTVASPQRNSLCYPLIVTPSLQPWQPVIHFLRPQFCTLGFLHKQNHTVCNPLRLALSSLSIMPQRSSKMMSVSRLHCFLFLSNTPLCGCPTVCSFFHWSTVGLFHLGSLRRVHVCTSLV